MPRIRSNNRDEADQKPMEEEKESSLEPEQLPHAHFPTMEPIA